MRNRRQNTCKTEKNTVIFEIPGKQKPAKAKKIIEKRHPNVEKSCEKPGNAEKQRET